MLCYLQAFPIQFNIDIHHNETWTWHNIHPTKTNHEYAKKCINCNLPKIIILPIYNFRKISLLVTLNTFFFNLIMKPASLEIVIFVIAISKMYIVCSKTILVFRLQLL